MPVVTEVSVLTEVPVVIEVPVVTEVSVVTEVPVVIEVPVVTEVSAVIEVPVVVSAVGNLLSRVAIRSRRTLICWSRLLYRLLRVPRVAAARANVIIPNRPIIPNVINTGILADPAPAINTYLIEK